jgi:hypothetical protein
LLWSVRAPTRLLANRCVGLGHRTVEFGASCLGLFSCTASLTVDRGVCAADDSSSSDERHAFGDIRFTRKQTLLSIASQPRWKSERQN